MRIFLILLMIAVFSGCAIPYVPPSEGPVAEMRVLNKSTMKLKLAFYEESRRCKRRRTPPVMEPQTEAVHTIYADRELTFQFLLDGGADGYCLDNIRFAPKANRKYFLEAGTEGTARTGGRCKMELLIMSMSGQYNVSADGLYERVPYEKIPWVSESTENGTFCKE